MSQTKFFLGANSPKGFYSLYDNFTDREKDRLYIIKSGPGSGKSTFMRIIAEEAEKKGLSTELIMCSGDPDSLDGVKIPEKHAAIVDGTSPHVIEPVFAGSGEVYINLSQFYSDDIRKAHGDIMSLTKAYKAYYAKAYKLIESACTARDALIPAVPEELKAAALKRADGIISRELRPSGKEAGAKTKRFLSAVSCKGRIVLFETVPALAKKVYVLDNDLGFAPLLMEKFASAAEKQGWDTIRCPSPTNPGITEHLIIPELSLAFVSQTSQEPYPYDLFRHLRLDAIPEKAAAAELKAAVKSADKVYGLLIDEAIGALKSAKALHDRLEAAYNPYVSFDSVRTLAHEYAEKLLRD